jgi:hypothetical protein
MILDELAVHSDDVHAGDGTEFYGTPIKEMSLVDIKVRADLFIQPLANAKPAPPVEVLPGEAIVGDLIRRTTTAEVVGESFYDKELPEGSQVSIEEAKEKTEAGVLVTWRPNGERFAVIYEEVASELPV